MTTIVTRPTPDTAGNGPYTLKCTLEELQLIGAYVHVTRLGRDSVYKMAAYNLINTLDELFDCEFTHESSEIVDLTVSQVDDQDTIVQTLPSEFFVLEV